MKIHGDEASKHPQFGNHEASSDPSIAEGSTSPTAQSRGWSNTLCDELHRLRSEMLTGMMEEPAQRLSALVQTYGAAARSPGADPIACADALAAIIDTATVVFARSDVTLAQKETCKGYAIQALQASEALGPTFLADSRLGGLSVLGLCLSCASKFQLQDGVRELADRWPPRGNDAVSDHLALIERHAGIAIAASTASKNGLMHESLIRAAELAESFPKPKWEPFRNARELLCEFLNFKPQANAEKDYRNLEIAAKRVAALATVTWACRECDTPGLKTFEKKLAKLTNSVLMDTPDSVAVRTILDPAFCYGRLQEQGMRFGSLTSTVSDARRQILANR